MHLMFESQAIAAYKTAMIRDDLRFPDMRDSRYKSVGATRAGCLFPKTTPKFKISPSDTVFTIGSCFAREIEGALKTLGCNVPVADFMVPQEELCNPPPHLLNEYTPGTISQRILSAFGKFDYPPDAGIEQGSQGFIDLFLHKNAFEIPLERVLERRSEITGLYEALPKADVVVITLGLVEAWFDKKFDCYLNRAPSMFAKTTKNTDQYFLRRLDYQDSCQLIRQAVACLVDSGIKRIILTVSPVPLDVTFMEEDVILENCYSKSTLRCVAEYIKREFPQVDYFPSYEIVMSFGLTAFIDDNIHLHPFVAEQIVRVMRETYL
jgi:hypothetical protein